MQRPPSTMSAADLQSWRDRHEHTLASGSAALGISPRMFAFYLSDEKPIPLTIALLAKALDRLSRRKHQ